jgi:RHS repeat-associated protein
MFQIPHRSTITLATFVLQLGFCCAFALFFVANVRAQEKGKQYTSTNKDQNERDSFEVDPASLAMTIKLPLATYPGRGMGLPISLSYSSKLWRVKYSTTQMTDDYGNGNGTPSRYLLYAAFAENTHNGWNSNFEMPWVEFTGFNEPFIARFRTSGREYEAPDDGQAWDYMFQPQSNQNSQAIMYYANRAMLHMPDGSSHEMRQDDLAYAGNTGPWNRMYFATDGSRIKYDPSNQTIFMPDGSRYVLTSATSAQYIDADGNTLQFTNGQWTDTLGRTFSNPLNASNCTNCSWTIPNAQGGTSTYIFRWRTLSEVRNDPAQPLHYVGSITPNPNYPQFPLYSDISPSLFGQTFLGFFSAPGAVVSYNAFGNPPDLFNPLLLSEIELPNEKKYQFKYNVYGEIEKIILPTGGYRRYRYEAVRTTDFDYNLGAYSQMNRGVVEAWDSETGTTAGETNPSWKYEPSPNNGTPFFIKATSPDGSYTKRFIQTQGTTGSQFGASLGSIVNGRIYDEQAFTPSNQMLRRSLSQYAFTGVQNAPSNPQANNPTGMDFVARDARMTRQVDILLDTGGNASAKATEMDYDADLNVIATRYYDYVSISQSVGQTGAISAIPNGTLLRSEETTYLVNDTSIAQTTRDAYRARNLVSLPSKSVVKNGAGAVVSASEIIYDEYTAAKYSHYAALPLLTYASVLNWNDPTTNVRGNATTTRSWNNNGNQSWSNWGVGSWIDTHTQYDQCGNVRKTWDGNNNLTQTNYNDSFTNAVNYNSYAYPTQTIAPITSIAASTKYDYSTGKVRETTDPNNTVTQVEYADALMRPTKTIRAFNTTLQNQTVISYDDTNRVITTATDKDGNTDGVIQTKSYADGSGRTYRTATLEGATWAIKETQFDVMDRPYRTSNPFRDTLPTAALPANPQWTTSTFDALSRVIQVTTSDGATVYTNYAGNQTTVTDQASKVRRSLSDALGRLSTIIEDPSGLNYTTTYQYDGLNNLAQVTQGAQQRYFMYDSLSRLLRARNPESVTNANLPALTDPLTGNSSWSMAYSYDSNSNLLSKTDANNVTTNYTYDALSRNIYIRYSSYPTGTAAVDLVYDTATNGKGKLGYTVAYNYRWDVDGRPYWDADVTTTYDALGRPTNKWQGFILSNGSNQATAWQPYDMSRTYNLAGMVTSETYPSGRTINHTYNAAGQTTAVGGTLGDGVGRSYSSGATYNPAGLLTYEVFGAAVTPYAAITTPLYHKRKYNSRQQPYDVRLSSVSGVNDSMTHGALQFFYATDAFEGTTNNGNVVRADSWAIKTDGSGAWMAQYDRFSYDGANRLLTLYESGNNSGNTADIFRFQQVFTYDRWGNRSIDVTNTTPNIPGLTRESCVIDTATNRMTQRNLLTMTYDSNGNQTHDGVYARIYQAENKLTKANSASGLNYFYYDAGGRRTRRVVGGLETWQMYGFEGQLVAEYNVSGTFSGSNFPAAATPTKEYGYRNGQLLVASDSTETDANQKFKWLVQDHLGSTRMEVGSNGSLTTMRRTDYAPFGEELQGGQRASMTGYGYTTVGSRQKFTGKERDNETSLDYFLARYYSSSQGRFTSPDEFNGGPVESFGLLAATNPVFYADITNPQSLNKYQYTYNNPLLYTDPDGHCPWCPAAGELLKSPVGQQIVAATGAAITAVMVATSDAGTQAKENIKKTWEKLKANASPGYACDSFEGCGYQQQMRDQSQGNNQGNQGQGGLQETKHAQKRKDEGSSGQDPRRDIGDKNRVKREGKRYVDQDTGNIVYVGKKGHTVIVDPTEQRVVTQNSYTKKQVQNRVNEGRWVPSSGSE